MGPWEKTNLFLNKKLEILAKITANTETQRRFIQQRKMKGLNRILQDQTALLEELAGVNQELDAEPVWKTISELAPLMQEVADKQQEVLARSSQALQQAVAEKTCIAAELKNSKVLRQVKNQYVNPWAVVMCGRRINEKG